MESHHHHYALGEEESVPVKGMDDDDDEEEDDSSLLPYGSSTNSMGNMDPGSATFTQLKLSHKSKEQDAADALSVRLLALNDDDSDEEDRILLETLDTFKDTPDEEELDPLPASRSRLFERKSVAFRSMFDGLEVAVAEKRRLAQRRVFVMVSVAFVFIVLLIVAFLATVQLVGPPSQPVGPYTLIQRQEGESFFEFYSFYEGPDSVGSNGYLQYVSKPFALTTGLINVTYEEDFLDSNKSFSARKLQVFESDSDGKPKEPFVYINSAATPEGPRNSIRLEGNRRFDRGLFVIDVRHMPSGCGQWPAFWLTDEANWPVNGEIDIVEGVNYQTVAKTALHSTKGCSMYDIPFDTMTGEWDTAQGIPDAKTGIPDMTLRYAQNCFVYDPHQWLNQGCVAVDKEGNTLGQPVNDNGGGVYVLEWDPMFRHIRTWVFSPHVNIPDNLAEAIRTASYPVDERVVPDPDIWPLPYGFFSIGAGTDCPSSHFRQMRLVLNTAFCGSVSGNRFFLDCPIQAKKFESCNDWIKSNPAEMDEAYWKIRGVYVYEREWRNTWLS